MGDVCFRAAGHALSHRRHVGWRNTTDHQAIPVADTLVVLEDHDGVRVQTQTATSEEGLGGQSSKDSEYWPTHSFSHSSSKSDRTRDQTLST